MVSVARVGQSTLAALRRHPRSLSAALILLLGGFAAAAFGVAPRLPDPSQLPQRQVVADLYPSGVQDQLSKLAEQELQLSRGDLTRRNDTVDTVLQRLGVGDAQAAAFMRSDTRMRRLFEGRAGKMVQARATADGALLELTARFAADNDAQGQPQFTRLSMKQVNGEWVSALETAALLPQVQLAGGTIRSSLFAATDEARIPDAVAVQIAEIFATDIDFRRELRKGDVFSVVYEALTADGEPVTWGPATGRVLAAQFINDGTTYQAMWFADKSGHGSYFGFDGQSKKRQFLASPMEFSRVTSLFSMRFHPLLKQWRRHLGVDYGAPTGTSVRSVGRGTVEFAGQQNGYGNVIIIKHDAHRSTLYAHLSRIDVRRGESIEQGEHIGAVGSTGWATGPHLHFEFRVDGEHRDPLVIAKASQTMRLSAADMPRFAELARGIKAQLELAQTLTDKGTQVARLE